jgi:ABC-type glutathione transport system ATPase component
VQSVFSSIPDNKQKLKEHLLELYKFHGFDLPEFSLLPPSSNGKKLKLRPLRITKQIPITKEDLETLSDTDLLDKEKFTNAQHIQSLYDTFHNGIEEAKNIYIVGESGSGITTVCRRIIQRWCAVHKIQENELTGVEANQASTPALRTNRDDFHSQRLTDVDWFIYVRQSVRLQQIVLLKIKSLHYNN